MIVREMALSDVEGTVKFQADGSTGAAIGSGGTYELRSGKLDTQQPRPAIMKIDIEGAEADMLLAAPETLKAKPRILLELHRVVPEEKKRAMWDMLKQSGYRLAAVVFRSSRSRRASLRSALKACITKTPGVARIARGFLLGQPLWGLVNHGLAAPRTPITDLSL